jgi:FRG domain
MRGQWIGNYGGTNTGTAVVDIDDMGDHFEGRAFVYDDRQDLPSTYAAIRTADKARKFQLKLELLPIHPLTGDPVTWPEIQKLFPAVSFSRIANTEWEWDDKQLSVSWVTDTGVSGTATVPKSKASEPSEYRPLNITSWEEFRRFVRDLEHYRYMYRGQESNQWRLRTCFHRMGRADLMRFLGVDVPALHQHLSSMTAHVFNLFDPIQHGAFVNLVQHHGYPTPLLDWTYSPFIGSYFAFNDLPRERVAPYRKVRIFVFDKLQWCMDFNQLQKLSPARPHFSILDALAINNPRMVPQQALSSVTNVDDIESYIKQRETERGKTYLQIVDLPASERRLVLQELSLMGITAGSLFPGIDGACMQLRARFFEP